MCLLRYKLIVVFAIDLRFTRTIICLFVGEKKVIHAAIFITADIVFTKNGYDFMYAWILMRKSDMLEVYKASYPASTLQPIYFRKRTI